MSIKSELRIIEQVDIPVSNGSFMGGNLSDWTGTGSTGWIHSDFTNSVRLSSTGSTDKLSQILSISGNTITTTYFPGSTPYKVVYSVFGDASSNWTFTPYLGGVAGTTRTQNGTYYDIFYIGDGNLLSINDTDYFKINDNDDFLIWG